MSKFFPGDQVQCTVGGGPHDGKRGRVVQFRADHPCGQPIYKVLFYDGTTAVVLETALKTR